MQPESKMIIDVPAIPKTIESFVALKEELCMLPQGAVALIIVALLIYVRNESLGQQCLAVASYRDTLWEGSEGYQGVQISGGLFQLIRSQIGGKEYVMRSYFKGTSSRHAYRLPDDPPYQVEVIRNQYSGDPRTSMLRLYVQSSGAAGPRQVTVRLEDTGLWKASDWISLLAGIDAPQNEIFVI